MRASAMSTDVLTRSTGRIRFRDRRWRVSVVSLAFHLHGIGMADLKVDAEDVPVSQAARWPAVNLQDAITGLQAGTSRGSVRHHLRHENGVAAEAVQPTERGFRSPD